MATEKEMLERLQRGEIEFPPLSIELREVRPAGEPGKRLDALARVRWGNRCYDFGLEMRSKSTPKAFQEAVNQAVCADRPKGTCPMVMLPYLSESQLRELERRGVSGIDLCGNGIIIVPGELFVTRTGQPNKFPSSAPIKNVYHKNSSIVARIFLLRPEYPTVGEIQAEVIRHRGRVNFSTVSKVLKALEEDLIVGRGSGKIRLLQPEKLLDKLVANYRKHEIKDWLHIKTMKPLDSLMVGLNERAKCANLQLVVSGADSTNFYGTMERGEILSLYCSDPRQLLLCVSYTENPRFPNLEVIQTEENAVYFDIRYQNGFPWASPIQTYLELMSGDQRDKDTAQQVRAYILKEIERLIA